MEKYQIKIKFHILHNSIFIYLNIAIKIFLFNLFVLCTYLSINKRSEVHHATYNKSLFSLYISQVKVNLISASKIIYFKTCTAKELKFSILRLKTKFYQTAASKNWKNEFFVCNYKVCMFC